MVVVVLILDILFDLTPQVRPDKFEKTMQSLVWNEINVELEVVVGLALKGVLVSSIKMTFDCTHCKVMTTNLSHRSTNHVCGA